MVHFRYSKRYLNYGFFYDGIRCGESTSKVFLSPFGVSYLTLTNNYKNVNHQMVLRIQISRGYFLFFLCVIRVFRSVSLLSNHRLYFLHKSKNVFYHLVIYFRLYANKMFYYAIFIVLSPIFVLLMVLYSIISSCKIFSLFI